MDLVVQREFAMARKEGRKPQYDNPVVQGELFAFLMGGHDTTYDTILWGLKYLTASQSIQDKLRSELRSKHNRAFAAGEDPRPEEIANTDVPYLDATV